MVGGCDGFSPTGDHELIKRLAREFAENEAAPTAAERDRERIWPAELVRKMGELGFMGIAVDESYGGAGAVSYSRMFDPRINANAGTNKRECGHK